MQKTIIVLAVTFAVQCFIQPAQAQQTGTVYKIGYLSAGKAKSLKARMNAFREGLKALGYVEGKNIVIEERYAAGRRTRLPDLAAQLVELGVDVIVTNGGTATLTADRVIKKAGKKIPVVFALAADPVGRGLVASLSRPGGNITGLSNSHGILIAKRLEVLKEFVPSATRIAVLWSPNTKNGPPQVKILEAAAPKLGVKLIPVAFTKPEEFDRAFSAVRAARSDALLILSWSMVNSFRKRIADHAIESRLPSLHSSPRYTRAGGLLSYGANTADMYRRAAALVVKVLKGTKPDDLPVQQPTKFYLTVNLRTAKALGMKVPRSIMLRADKVIE